jgi:hypothetical protein
MLINKKAIDRRPIANILKWICLLVNFRLPENGKHFNHQAGKN